MPILLLARRGERVRVLDFSLPDKETRTSIVRLGCTEAAFALSAVEAVSSVQFLKPLGGTSMPDQAEDVALCVRLSAVTFEGTTSLVNRVDETEAVGGQTVVLSHGDAAARTRPVLNHGQTLTVSVVLRVKELLVSLLLDFVICHKVPSSTLDIVSLSEVIDLEFDRKRHRNLAS
jgi:hypothetical protein